MSKRNAPVQQTFNAAREYEAIQRYVTRRTHGRLETVRADFIADVQTYGAIAAMQNVGAEIVRAEELFRLSADLLNMLTLTNYGTINETIKQVKQMLADVDRKLVERNPFEIAHSNVLSQGVYQEQCSATYRYRQLLVDVLEQLGSLMQMLEVELTTLER